MIELEEGGGALGVEVRAAGTARTLVGYAAVFNRDTEIAGFDRFIERIAPGAFSAAIQGDVLALINHDFGRVIGRTKSGTLRLTEDATGLRVEIDVPNTTDGNDLWESVGRQDITGMSFGFIAKRQAWDESGDIPQRTILEADLLEVTATPIPAYRDTTIARRSLIAWREQKSTAERHSREATIAAQRRAAARAAQMEQAIRGIR